MVASEGAGYGGGGQPASGLLCWSVFVAQLACFNSKLASL